MKLRERCRQLYDSREQQMRVRFTRPEFRLGALIMHLPSFKRCHTGALFDLGFIFINPLACVVPSPPFFFVVDTVHACLSLLRLFLTQKYVRAAHDIAHPGGTPQPIPYATSCGTASKPTTTSVPTPIRIAGTPQKRSICASSRRNGGDAV